MTQPPGYGPPPNQPGGQPPSGGEPPHGQPPYGPPGPGPYGPPGPGPRQPYGPTGQPYPGQPPAGGPPAGGQPPYGPPGGQPPHGGQPPYGPPGGYGGGPGGPYGGPPRRSKLPWILGGTGAAAAVAVVLILVFVVFNGGGDESSPKSAVSAFLDAAKGPDIDGMAKVSCAPLAKQLKEHAGSVSKSIGGGDEKLVSYSVDSVDTHGDTADVDVSEKSNEGHTAHETYITQKDSDDWTVCGVKGSFDFTGGGDDPQPSADSSEDLPSGLPSDLPSLPSGLPSLPSGLPSLPNLPSLPSLPTGN